MKMRKIKLGLAALLLGSTIGCLKEVPKVGTLQKWMDLEVKNLQKYGEGKWKGEYKNKTYHIIVNEPESKIGIYYEK